MAVLENIRAGILAAVDALHKGYVPFCPFLDFLFILLNGQKPLSAKAMRRYSLGWLRVCDEIWLLPSWEQSAGANVELAEAKRLGLKVVYL